MIERPEAISDKWNLFDYQDINDNNISKKIESRNFQKVAGFLADWGLECTWTRDDSQGVDFIARHMLTNETIPIQLKSRLTIGERYLKYKNLWVAFRVREDWYLVKHDDLVKLADDLGWSWRRGRTDYTNQSPSREKFLEVIKSNRIGTES